MSEERKFMSHAERRRTEHGVYCMLTSDPPTISISRSRELLGFADMNQMRDWLDLYAKMQEDKIK